MRLQRCRRRWKRVGEGKKTNKQEKRRGERKNHKRILLSLLKIGIESVKLKRRFNFIKIQNL